MKPSLAVCIGAFEPGGQGTVVEKELEHLSERFRVTLLAERIERAVPAGVETRIVDVWAPFPRSSETTVRELSRFDLIHSLDSLGFMACARRAGRPWVVTSLGICPPRFRTSTRSKLEGAATLALYPPLYRRATVVTAISDYLGRWVRAFASVEPVVIPLGVSPTDGPPPPAPDNCRLLYVGEISDRKGIADLLTGLAATEQPVALDLVGRGDIERFRRLSVTLGVGDRVRFHGLVSDETLANCYRSALAVCSASHWEGFGLLVLEGFAYGRPAIVRRQGGMREQIEQSGAGECFSTPDEVPACVERVRRDWPALSLAARRFADRHPWSSTFDRYSALFLDVLAA